LDLGDVQVYALLSNTYDVASKWGLECKNWTTERMISSENEIVGARLDEVCIKRCI